MKELIAKSLLIVFDALMIFIALIAAYYLRLLLADHFVRLPSHNLQHYLHITSIYSVILLVMMYEGIYTKRFDFWQEHKRITASLAISLIVIFAFLALQKETESYSRFIIITSFVIMLIIIPIEKRLVKYWLYHLGLWNRKALVLGQDPFFIEHVFGNPYLGYVQGDDQTSKTLFIASDYRHVQEIEKILDNSVKRNQEVIFIPLIKSYDFSDSFIIHIFNARTNLVVLQNKLLNPFNQLLKGISDYLLTLLLLPFIVIVMICIFILIKREEPKGSVFFKQNRMGRDAKPFICYKFRTMRENSEGILREYLANNPYELDHYALFHKYTCDPRITKIGTFLRKTSLDELPQIFNILKGEMSLIGPRPYMPQESEKIGDKLSMILAVKPGITGLWQVSGRSELDFMSRVTLDAWYVRNWSLWTDFVILVKTVKVVLKREGAL
ncbi:MAG TPA: exopolysaccharide biosynthesis polyprenyl glycosylphosphotransferase [Sulfuricurvum sp.]|nr:MAG: glycosyl transferase [Campylobacterales bacterium 16-40-21]OZA02645.1 MAG: glycosyl transferase [Sulfuricurvum sp. 17-40-25]HQS67421.1 exopolysaccharide biosynthesis polyprenyl glycosylphosphotransferase [Sulfuricurvum sp.]HQT36461.1 exopolysaccharide biosynthesis polyprenyl glycosylphosphotransferase [Sulfuricurvum sp.]